MMDSGNFTHGLCQDCLTSCNWDAMRSKKQLTCILCSKEPDILYNQEPYCSACYILTMSSPAKSEISQGSRHKKTKSFLRPVNKEQIMMNNSFFSSAGKLIKKIEKLFTSQQRQNNLISYLNKKAISHGQITYEKLMTKVSKVSSIIYIFVGKQSIAGAFHTESISLDGEHSVQDSESGLFCTDRYNFDLQFSKVKDDRITYSKKTKLVRFGSPSSFEISFQKEVKVDTELFPKFQWVYFYIYKP